MGKSTPEALRKIVDENIQVIRSEHFKSLAESVEPIEMTPGFIEMLEREKRYLTAENLRNLPELFDVFAEILLYPIEVKKPAKSIRRTPRSKVRSILYGLNEADLDVVQFVIWRTLSCRKIEDYCFSVITLLFQQNHS